MRSLLFTLLFCIPQAVVAQTTAPLSVEDAVNQAVKKNPRIAAVVREVSAAELGKRSAQAWANPQISFTPAITTGGSDEEVLVQQPLELNGARSARTGVAEAQVRAARAESILELRRLVFDTKSAYYELVRARDQRLLAADLLKSAETVEHTTQRQVDLGRRPGIDLAQTGIEVVRAKQQLTQAESKEAIALAALNTLMGNLPSEPIAALPSLSFAPVKLDDETALRQGMSNRSEINKEEAVAEGLRQEARLARAEGQPDLVPQFRAGTVTRGVHETGIGLGISLPILDYGSRRNKIRQSEELARAQTSRTEIARNQIREEVHQALIRVKAAEAVVQSYQSGVLERAQKLLQASQTGFQEGQTSVLALLEAQRTFRSVQTEYTNALAEHALARTDLERATGAVPANLISTVNPAGSAKRRP